MPNPIARRIITEGMVHYSNVDALRLRRVIARRGLAPLLAALARAVTAPDPEPELAEDVTGLAGLPQPLGKATKCPVCNGYGVDDKGRPCKACGGTVVIKSTQMTEAARRLLEVARLSRYAAVIRILPTSFWISADYTGTIREAVNLIIASLPAEKRGFFKPWYITEFDDTDRWYRKSHGWIAENGEPLTADEIWRVIDFVQENLTSNKAGWRVKVFSEDGPEWRNSGPDAVRLRSESDKPTARELIEALTR